MTDGTHPTPPVLRLGSDRNRCDLYVLRKTVSGVHATISLGEDGALMLTDPGSTNGVYLHGDRLPANTPTEVRLGDKISLGRGTVFQLADWHVEPLYDPSDRRSPRPLLDPPPATKAVHATMAMPEDPALRQLAAAMADAERSVSESGSRSKSSSESRGATLVLSTPGVEPSTAEIPSAASAAPASDDAPTLPPAGSPSVSLGYAATNDIIIPNPVVSGRHARIYRIDGGYVLEDQTSTNGTFVGGRRVHRSALTLGDTFALGSHALVFDEALRARVDERATARTDEIPLAPGRVLRIGREPSNDVVLAAPTVSKRHAELEVLPSGAGYVVRDLGSQNGVFLNSRVNRVEGEATVSPDDVVFFGSYRLPIARVPSMLRVDNVAADGKRTFVVGRDPEQTDVALDSPVVSSRHAEIEVLEEGRFRVRDLGSSNGTYLNGIKIRGAKVATAEDRVSFGSYEVRLDPTHGVVRKEFHGDIMLQAERVTVEVPDAGERGEVKRILDDVSFTVYPTEFVGLMGPSGAGKTTLMMALAGIMPPARGRSLINGLDVYERYDAFRGNIGYVPQDDIVYPQLTVYESLYFTARLRLPPDTTRAEIDAKIRRILEQLEISHTADTLIGDALEKGISGGERKRVNLAQELITEPALLFLDEPTSGLASEDTINVMRLLRGMANSGKTVLLTIHQPSLEAYRLMDTVIYMYRGNLVYYGPSYPDSILHFNEATPEGPARDALLADPGNAMKPLAAEQRAALAEGDAGALQGIVGRRRAAYERSRYHRQYVADRVGDAPEIDVARDGKQKTSRRGARRQLAVLTRRALQIKRKDRVNTAILLAQAPVIALILTMVFANETNTYFDTIARGPAALFLLVASAVWFGCSNAAREIVSEQAIYRRERMVNLTIPAYALSKVLVLGGACAVQVLLLLGIAYVPLGLEGSFLAHYAVLLLTSLVGLGMGLTLSALVRSPQAAMALVPIMLIPQIILGGVIMPVHEMSTPTRALAALTATRWGFEAALYTEYADDDPARVQEACDIPECVWGAGSTGGEFVYYPGDPDAVTTSAETAGVESLVGGQVPYAQPNDAPICHAFCAAMKEGDEVTPLDRSFGPDPTDPTRRAAYQAIAVDGHAPDQSATPTRSLRTSMGAALGTLFAHFAFLVLLVMALLRARDVEVD